ncbi:superoxide dismutase family protein [Streptomyces sp. NPDC048560]|uniref:superoxide dismutase family protein n=1 Tax=Streptomyces sp. NPDC048560 TaxID=3155488 RepID=UPI0034406A36
MVAAGRAARAAGAVAVAAALVVLAGGASGASGAGGVGGGHGGDGFRSRSHASFAPPNAFVAPSAVTYDMERVPAGARIEITQHSDRSGTVVEARLRGLLPDHAYGMHVHTSPCGADPKSAGPHYRHRAEGPAGPAGEVWLDFATDAEGDGSSRARHDWGFREGGARSVVIHDRQGGAGDRLACYTVPFGSYGTV